MLKKTRFIGLLVGVFLLAISVSPVFAAAPLPVHIVADETFGVGSVDPFTASSPAVVNGLICAAGTVEDLEVTFNNPAGPYQTLWALKRFYCGDGTFDLHMVVRLDLDTRDTTARWRILGGTGQYAGLKGHGSLVGESYYPADGILDIYDGVLH